MALELKIAPDSPIVQAAVAMVEAHRRNETMLSAVYEVQEEFPDLDVGQGILLWLGVNAKNREG